MDGTTVKSMGDWAWFGSVSSLLSDALNRVGDQIQFIES